MNIHVLQHKCNKVGIHNCPKRYFGEFDLANFHFTGN